MADFKQSRKLTWYTMGLISLQSVGIMVNPSPEAAQVFTIAIPIEGGLAAAWTGISNWRETKEMESTVTIYPDREEEIT